MTARCPDPAIHERLAAYELGLLPDDERREVEAHLLRCPLCAEELWATAPFASAATEAPGEVLAELPRPAPPAVADRLRSWWERRARVLVPAAALAGLTVMMLYEMTPPGTASLASLEPLPWVRVDVRDDPDVASLRLEAALDLYADGDYRTASDALAPLATGQELPGPQRERAALYLGVARLLSRDAEGAVAALVPVTGSEVAVTADRATWYLAQARLVRNEPAAAESLLERLATSPGYASEAGGLLERLRERVPELRDDR